MLKRTEKQHQQRVLLRAFWQAQQARKTTLDEADAKRIKDLQSLEESVKKTRKDIAGWLSTVERVYQKMTQQMTDEPLSSFIRRDILPSFQCNGVEAIQGLEVRAKTADAYSKDLDSTLNEWAAWKAAHRKHLTILAQVATIMGILLFVCLVIIFQIYKYQRVANTHYEAAVLAVSNGQWESALQNIDELHQFPYLWGYKDSRNLFLESNYQLGTQALERKDWLEAWHYWIEIRTVDRNYKDAEKIALRALFKGSVASRTVDLFLKAPESNVNSPNTHMEMDELKIDSNGTIRLSLTIVVDSGDETTIYKPKSVYIESDKQELVATYWSGLFGNKSTIEELKLGGRGDQGIGWIEFSKIAPELPENTCFEFHYGVYYSFEKICILP